jgi:hypothetical protein
VPTPPAGGPNRGNKVVAVVVAGVLVVAVVVAGVLLALSRGDGSADDKAGPKGPGSATDGADGADGGSASGDEPTPTPSPSESRTTYELAFPKTLEHGKYRLKKDLSDTVGSGTVKPGEKAHLGSYANASDTSRLLYGAATGEDYGNPEFSKNQMMNGMETGSGIDVAVKRRDITPDGADPLTCEVLVKSQAGRKLTIPVCAWSDPGTAAYVADDSLATYSVEPGKVDLDKWANRVSDIRDEVRTPAG